MHRADPEKAVHCSYLLTAFFWLDSLYLRHFGSKLLNYIFRRIGSMGSEPTAFYFPGDCSTLSYERNQTYLLIFSVSQKQSFSISEFFHFPIFFFHSFRNFSTSLAWNFFEVPRAIFRCPVHHFHIFSSSIHHCIKFFSFHWCKNLSMPLKTLNIFKVSYAISYCLTFYPSLEYNIAML